MQEHIRKINVLCENTIKQLKASTSNKTPEGSIKPASVILKNVPGYNPKTNTVVQGGNVGVPSGHNKAFKVMAASATAATILSAPLVPHVHKVLDKWDTFVDNTVIPTAKNIKSKIVGGSKKYPGAKGA